MSQQPTSKTDFTGTWVLEKSENLDQFLKDKGIGLLKRKAASGVSVTQTITQKDSSITIKISSLNKEDTKVIPLDGKTPFKGKDRDGNDISILAKWSSDNKIILADMTNIKTNKTAKSQRYMKGDRMVLQITNPKGTTLKRIFKKQ